MQYIGMYSDGVMRQAGNLDMELAASTPKRDGIARLFQNKREEEIADLKMLNDWYRLQLEPKARSAGA